MQNQHIIINPRTLGVIVVQAADWLSACEASGIRDGCIAHSEPDGQVTAFTVSHGLPLGITAPSLERALAAVVTHSEGQRKADERHREFLAQEACQ